MTLIRAVMSKEQYRVNERVTDDDSYFVIIIAKNSSVGFNQKKVSQSVICHDGYVEGTI